MNTQPRRNDLLYPELSYLIVGCAFEVWNSLGPGHSEKTYQEAMETMFREKNISYNSQAYAPVMFKNKLLSKRFIDFIVEDKIVVELKKNEHFAIGHIKQIHDYLVRSQLQLGILINFTFAEVKTKRVVNQLDS
jgi:GxxExxY protein